MKLLRENAEYYSVRADRWEQEGNFKFMRENARMAANFYMQLGWQFWDSKDHDSARLEWQKAERALRRGKSYVWAKEVESWRTAISAFCCRPQFIIHPKTLADLQRTHQK